MAVLFSYSVSTVTAKLQICRNYNDGLSCCHGAAWAAGQTKSSFRLLYVHQKNQRIEGRADFRKWIKCCGKQWFSLWRAAAAGLSFTNCSPALHHYPLGFMGKNYAGREKMAKKQQQQQQHNKNKWTSESSGPSFRKKNISGCGSASQPAAGWLSGIPTVSRADGRVYGGLQVWKTHALGRNKECCLHQNGPRTEGMECLSLKPKKVGTSSVLPTSRCELCVFEGVWKKARGGPLMPLLFFFPTERTWRSKRDKHGRGMTRLCLCACTCVI